MAQDLLEPKNGIDPIWKTVPFLTVLAIMGTFAFIITFFTAPLGSLLGESAHALDSAIHGLLAGILMVTVTIGLFEGLRLYAGNIRNVQELLFGSLFNAGLALLTIITGNKIYIAYRAKGGPRTYFLENVPEVHKIFFEFKEFMALLVFPLAVVVAFIVIYYRNDLLKRKELTTILFISLLLMFFYFVVTFGLGAAITKLRAV